MNNKKAVTDMTIGNPISQIIIFMIPLLIGNIFQQAYSIVDTVVVGHILGESALAAIGATSSIYSLLVNIAFGLNSGYGIIIGKVFGSKDYSKLKQTIAMTFVLNISIGSLLTILGLAFINQIMVLMNVPLVILTDTLCYISIIIAGMFTTIFYNLFAGIMRSVGNSKAPLLFLIISSVLNCIIDVLFVAVFGMGISGAALATVISQGVSAILSGVYLWVNYKEYLPTKNDFKPSFEIFNELFSMGVSMAAMLTVVNLGSIAYQRAINELGNLYITAHTASRKLIQIFMMPLASIATANSTFVAQNWGAKKTRRIKDTIKTVLGLEIGWALFAFFVIILFGEGIIFALTGSQNRFVIEKAMLSLRAHFVCYPALGVLLALRTTLQALGQKIIPIISSTVELVVKVIFGFYVIPKIGYIAVCIAEPVIWTACMVFLAIYCLKKNLFSKDDNINI